MSRRLWWGVIAVVGLGCGPSQSYCNLLASLLEDDANCTGIDPESFDVRSCVQAARGSCTRADLQVLELEAECPPACAGDTDATLSCLKDIEFEVSSDCSAAIRRTIPEPAE